MCQFGGKSKPLNGFKLGSDIFHLHFRKIVLWPLDRKQTGSREILTVMRLLVLMRDNGDPDKGRIVQMERKGQIQEAFRMDVADVNIQSELRCAEIRVSL